ncbi:MAG: exodeoxyribonuclease VII small subunit [Candidatus Aminicenantes bacterium]|jgi:exodeoxyribonuclease VII small subunit|nr:exodeoxyribonuclease VII small subunit [Candidatus Aminicenantes bacterium]
MAEQNFEKALEELEKIVGRLEESGASLNESLALFEKGVQLARFLRKELEKAEKKIEILMKDTNGEVKAEPFESDSAESEPGDDDPSEPGDNSTLPF